MHNQALNKDTTLTLFNQDIQTIHKINKERFDKAQFPGEDVISEKDTIALRGQIKRIYDCMKDGKWRTLDEIATLTSDPILRIKDETPSISAQLRHLRKRAFGNHKVMRQRRTGRLNEYKLIINKN